MEHSFEQYNLGGIKSPPDYRDIALADVLAPVDLPKEHFVDISNLPIWWQKKIGSCTGQAGAKYCQKQEELETKKVVDFSPRFLYAMAKCQDGYKEEGTYPRLIMKIRQQYGCATEATVPNNCDLTHEEYVYERKIENIPASAFEEAKNYKIKSYAIVGTALDEIKQAVFQTNGCMMLTRVGNPWWTDKNGKVTWSPTGLFPLRPPEVVTGGHETYVYGFRSLSNGKTEIHFVNSWSKQWGNNGTGWFIYEDYKPFIDECITAIDLPNNFIEEVKKLPPPEKFSHLFVGTIKYGQTNNEVKALQIALKLEGLFPVGQKETGFYGEKTRQAVRAFQTKYAVASWLELKLVNGKTVGNKTILALNKLYYKP